MSSDRRVSVTTFLRITTLDLLDEEAKANNTSRSKFIEKTIEEHLTNPEAST